MSNYLYGAAVQGIQSFIFQTNKLKEIVGASELVEEICTSFFETQVNKYGRFDENNLILGAAGNIKYIFDNKEECENIVRNFPKAVMEMAPGITISQAVVNLEDVVENANDELEKKLRIQRNKVNSITNGVGLMATETAPRTGGIGFAYGKGKNAKVIDKAQHLKRKASEKANFKLLSKIAESKKEGSFPYDINEIIKGEENSSWIAVIHADGNSLGQVIMDMTKGVDQKTSFQALKNFSQKLNEVTETAVKNAFEKVMTDQKFSNSPNEKIPFRPVVLGGDDLVAIIRGDLALDFTEAFLDEFEALSKTNFLSFAKDNKLNNNPFENGLTSCAGIAYIKANYPFHYGVVLAETLCDEAKRASKSINKTHAPSSVMLHKVQASFVEEYEDIIEKELKAGDNIYFNYGPYFIQPQAGHSTTTELKRRIENINKPTAPKSGLRNWLTELKQNPENAEQLLQRLKEINPGYRDLDLLEKPFDERKVKENGITKNGKFTPIFDIIALSNIQKSK